MTAAQKVALVVDDSLDDVFLVKRAIADAGFRYAVYSSTSAGQALAYLAGRRHYARRDLYPVPSLVVLDLRLGDGSGLDVLRWMRERPEHAQTPALVVSALPEPGEELAVRRLGGDFVAKPVTRERLLEPLRALG
jgi:DNA-binding response OmpR family regulator